MIKSFDFTAPEFINGRWINTRRRGSGRVLSARPGGNDSVDGYHTSNGGYVLEVLDSNHYDAGTIITLSRDSVR